MIKDKEKFKLWMDGNIKRFRSKSYNWDFDITSGFMCRWGKNFEDDPEYSPFTPEILDVEITSICEGMPTLVSSKNGENIVKNVPCKFCYHANGRNGKNMSFETFKKVIDNLPHVIDKEGKKVFFLNQLAAGLDARAESNPEIWKMMEYLRSVGIVPNTTVAQVTEKNIDNLVKYTGAVAISRYEDKNICYDSVKALTDRGKNQINIHILVCEEGYDRILETFNDILTDPRLKKLNAIVLLALKRVGRGGIYHSLAQDKFEGLIKYALDREIRIGFDSCSCARFLKSVKNHPNFKQFTQVAESCCSSCFSAFVDVEGQFHACSFTKKNSFSLDATKNKWLDMWYDKSVQNFREKLLETTKRNEFKCRECPIYVI